MYIFSAQFLRQELGVCVDCDFVFLHNMRSLGREEERGNGGVGGGGAKKDLILLVTWKLIV